MKHDLQNDISTKGAGCYAGVLLSHMQTMQNTTAFWKSARRGDQPNRGAKSKPWEKACRKCAEVTSRSARLLCWKHSVRRIMQKSVPKASQVQPYSCAESTPQEKACQTVCQRHVQVSQIAALKAHLKRKHAKQWAEGKLSSAISLCKEHAIRGIM